MLYIYTHIGHFKIIQKRVKIFILEGIRTVKASKVSSKGRVSSVLPPTRTQDIRAIQ